MKTSRATAFVLASLLAVMLLVTGGVDARAAEPAPSAIRIEHYRDGAYQIEARRLAGPAIDPHGRRLTSVELYYPALDLTVGAAVDATAIVELTPAPSAAAAAQHALDGTGAVAIRPLMAPAGLWLVRDTEGADGLGLAARLTRAHRRAIRRVIPNLYFRLQRLGDPYVPNDPRFGGQWYFDNLRMSDAWALEQGDGSSTIVIVDTGCDLDHPDLVAKMDAGLDVVDGDNDPTYVASEDGAAHGTSCAGLAAADTNNGEGIAGGCPGCRLRCVRLIAPVALPVSATVSAFDYALQVDAAVVSNSWGYVDPIPVPVPVESAINTLFDSGRGGRGALVLFAAGNDDRELGQNEMEAVRGALTIGAINNLDDQTPFTNYGSPLDLVAPTGTLATDIAGAEGFDPGDYTSTFGGTSSACPVAAGVAGLLVSAAPDLTAAALYDVMIRTASRAPYAVPDTNGHDPVYGYGIVNPVGALRDALGLPPENDGGGGGSSSGAGGADAPAASPQVASGGCGCRAGGGGGGTAALGWLLLGWLGCRRRSRRRLGGAGTGSP